jgi:Fic family protein
MITPIYQVSAEAIRLISEISEQIGILKALMPKTLKTESISQELPFDPFLEDDLLRAQKKMVDELSTSGGYYRTDDQRVKLHMAMLFDWLNHTDEHPLISSCIFHYELTAIHPFLEGNERLGLYWQMLLLRRWQPILADLSIEQAVIDRHAEYCRVMAYFGEIAKTSHFIEFILGCLLDVLEREVKNKVENKVKNKSREKVEENTFKNALPAGDEVQFSKSEQRVVKLLATDPRITIGALSRRLQLSEAGINKVLAALRKKGIIERVGANKNGSWKVNI